MADMRLEGGAADLRAVEIAGPYAEILGERHRHEETGAGHTPGAGGEEPVDIVEGKPGLVERRFPRARLYLQDGAVLGEHALPQRRVGHAHLPCLPFPPSPLYPKRPRSQPPRHTFNWRR